MLTRTDLQGTDEAQWRRELAGSPHVDTLVGWLHEAALAFPSVRAPGVFAATHSTNCRTPPHVVLRRLRSL